MFTGIIQDQGRILEVQDNESGMLLRIQTALDPKHLSVGNSIAVDGVCLTVEDAQGQIFSATAVPETLKRSHFSTIKPEAKVNLEAPLTMETPLAGHFVSGHVDAVAEVQALSPLLTLKVPGNLLKFLPLKGSVTVNGVSLTIAQSTGDGISIALIPETLQSTNLGALQLGDLVNIEIDLLARYLDQLHS